MKEEYEIMKCVVWRCDFSKLKNDLKTRYMSCVGMHPYAFRDLPTGELCRPPIDPHSPHLFSFRPGLGWKFIVPPLKINKKSHQKNSSKNSKKSRIFWSKNSVDSRCWTLNFWSFFPLILCTILVLSDPGQPFFFKTLS